VIKKDLSIFLISAMLLILIAFIQFAQSASEYKANTTMNLTVRFYISIMPSQALSDGIQFSSVDPGTSNNFAINDTTGDYQLNSTHYSTDYYLTVDSSTNGLVDFYNKDDDGFINITSSIGFSIQNVTIEANKTATGTNLNYTKAIEPNNVKLTSFWTKIGGDVLAPCDATPGGQSCYILYFIDVPNGQLAGVYSTTYCFCAVQSGAGSSNCGCA